MEPLVTLDLTNLFIDDNCAVMTVKELAAYLDDALTYEQLGRLVGALLKGKIDDKPELITLPPPAVEDIIAEMESALPPHQLAKLIGLLLDSGKLEWVDADGIVIESTPP